MSDDLQYFPGAVQQRPDDMGWRSIAAPTTIGEKFDANVRAMMRVENTDGAARLRREETARRLSEIADRTGVNLPNPYTQSYDEVDEEAVRRRALAQMGARGARSNWWEVGNTEYRDARIAAMEARINQLAEQYPDIETAERFDMRLKARGQELKINTYDTGLVGFAGSVAGTFADPVNLATLPLGGTGKSILQVAAQEAALNAGIELASQPFVARNYSELGLEFTRLDAFENVGAAAVFGGALGGGGKALEKGLRRIVEARSPQEAISAFDDLEPGLATPEMAAARIELDAEMRETERGGFDQGGEVDQMIAHARATGDAYRALMRGADPDDFPDAPAAAGPETPDTPLPGGVVAVDPLTLLVDAKRFQFKSGGDAEGVTDALRDVAQWDPIKSGTIIVWEDRAGQRFVADGHQRSGLARRLAEQGQKVVLNAHVLREADGITDAQARAMAAAVNIAQGTGSAVDAAKILKSSPELLDGSLSPRGRIVRDAYPLAQLSDDAFGMVINEVVDPAHGAIVGRMITDPAEQVAVLGLLARANPATLVEAEALVRDARASGFSKAEQTGLFGTDAVAESLLLERSAILSRSVAQLRRDKRIFATLDREADTIQAAGNRLNAERNRELAANAEKIAEAVLRTAYVKGPVSDALRAASEFATNGGNRAAATRRFIDALRELGAARLLELDGAGGSPRGTGAGDANGAPGGRSAQAAPAVDPTALSEFDAPLAGAKANADNVEADLFGGDLPEDGLFSGTVARDGGEPELTLETPDDVQRAIADEEDLISRFEACLTPKRGDA